jgi:hypothetical protein
LSHSSSTQVTLGDQSGPKSQDGRDASEKSLAVDYPGEHSKDIENPTLKKKGFKKAKGTPKLSLQEASELLEN